jgi:hypothetical protein
VTAQGDFGGVASFDQRQAEAIDRLRKNKHGFVLFTVTEAGAERIRMKYVGSMDNRIGGAFLAGIIETAHEALTAHSEGNEEEDDAAT